MRSSISDRYGMAITEGLFMSSRDGVNFDRWQLPYQAGRLPSGALKACGERKI
jgi:hypothetical protein